MQSPLPSFLKPGHSAAPLESESAAGEKLTVLIFKDNDTARVFNVPLRWLTQFGWLLGAIFVGFVMTLALSAYLGVRLITRSSPDAHTPMVAAQRVAELEGQLKSLSQKLEEQRLAAAPQSSPEPIISPGAETAVNPATPLDTSPYLFYGLPQQIQAPPAQITVAVKAPEMSWSGKILHVRFGVEYVGAGGSQQGRILVLARGPSLVLGYPKRIFYGTGQKALINPDQGEHFSVAHYRETNADFGPIASKELVQTIEIIIVGQDGKLLLHEMLPVDENSAQDPREQL